MKKIKVLFTAAALVIGVGSAFAFVDDPLCSQSVPGYTQVPPSGSNPNDYLIPGTFGTAPGQYDCLADPSQICRYVKNAQGQYLPCTGERFIH